MGTCELSGGYQNCTAVAEHGCAYGCDIAFSDYVFGCDGNWTGYGIDSAADLCAPGYEVCSDGIDTENLGLTWDNCMHCPAADYFYASASQSSGNWMCSGVGSDDVFGCGNKDTTWLTWNDTFVDCGPFGSVLDWDYCGDAYQYSWYPWNLVDGDGTDIGDSTHELDQVRKTKLGNGGVLCCNTAQIEAVQPCGADNGCSGDRSCDIAFSDNVYGCSGSWELEGIGNAAALCADGYEICNHPNKAEALGLTRDNCTSLPEPGYFYATAVQSDVGICQGTGWNDVYGCASSDGFFGWMDDTYLVCGPYGAQLSWNSGGAWDYGWELWNVNQTKELQGLRHWNDIGGVMCCNTAALEDIYIDDDCIGCSGDAASCDIKFSDDVYGCSGVWAKDAGMASQAAEDLCADGYEMCSSMEYTEAIGLTKEDCTTLPDTDYFYASAARADVGWTCGDDDTGSDDIYGCGSSDSTLGWINIGGDSLNCGPFGAAISEGSNSGEAWKWGWENLWDNDVSDPATSEWSTIWHRSARDTYTVMGGVLCCNSQALINAATTSQPDGTRDIDDMFSGEDESDLVDATVNRIELEVALTLQYVFNNRSAMWSIFENAWINLVANVAAPSDVFIESWNLTCGTTETCVDSDGNSVTDHTDDWWWQCEQCDVEVTMSATWDWDTASWDTILSAYNDETEDSQTDFTTALLTYSDDSFGDGGFGTISVTSYEVSAVIVDESGDDASTLKIFASLFFTTFLLAVITL